MVNLHTTANNDVSAYQIALDMYDMYKDTYVCASFSNNKWYFFENHKWTNDMCYISLRSKIGIEVYDMYASKPDTRYFTKVLILLRTTSFKESIMSECRGLFYDKDFFNKLDVNQNLICFNNGVFDLQKYDFRDGKPNDFLTLSTNINYIPFDPNSKIVHEIDTYMSQVFIDTHTRNIVWNILSNYVYGRKTDTINSTIFVGDGGSNSKSTLIKLFESVLGDYACKLPINLLTTELSLSHVQIGLVQSMNKRVVSFQTPSITESINFNSLKRLSNTNRIYGRRLYCAPIEFTPIFNTILVCNNTTNVSNITMSDVIKLSDYNIVEFKSKFVNIPDPENPYEFRKHHHLSDRMQKWSETFMSILLCNYS
jgi:hypothetical protein